MSSLTIRLNCKIGAQLFLIPPKEAHGHGEVGVQFLRYDPADGEWKGCTDSLVNKWYLMNLNVRAWFSRDTDLNFGKIYDSVCYRDVYSVGQGAVAEMAKTLSRIENGLFRRTMKRGFRAPSFSRYVMDVCETMKVGTFLTLGPHHALVELTPEEAINYLDNKFKSVI